MNRKERKQGGGGGQGGSGGSDGGGDGGDDSTRTEVSDAGAGVSTVVSLLHAESIVVRSPLRTVGVAVIVEAETVAPIEADGKKKKAGSAADDDEGFSFDNYEFSCRCTNGYGARNVWQSRSFLGTIGRRDRETADLQCNRMEARVCRCCHSYEEIRRHPGAFAVEGSDPRYGFRFGIRRRRPVRAIFPQQQLKKQAVEVTEISLPVDDATLVNPGECFLEFDKSEWGIPCVVPASAKEFRILASV